MKGPGILGTSVFNIEGDKNQFSNNVESLASSEFFNFEIIFDEIQKLFQLQTTE
jgi:hypothetical protein